MPLLDKKSSGRNYPADDSGRRANPSQRTQDVTSSTAASSTRNTASSTQPVYISGRAGGPSIQVTTNQMQSLNVGSPPTYGSGSAGQSAGPRQPDYSSNLSNQQRDLQSTSQSSGPRASPYSVASTDSRTGLQPVQQSSVGRAAGYATTSSDSRTVQSAFQQGSGSRGTGYSSTSTVDPRAASQNITPSTGSRNIGTTTAGIDQRQTAQITASSSAVRSKAPYTATVSDQRTGLQTRWEVSETTTYRDPGNEGSNRGLNIKRIRQVDGGRGGQGPALGKDFKTYRVIEVALVPPEDVETSNVSRITPTGTGLVRNRRFVIIREIPENGSFEALAIKTYNQRGVAAPGVIKSHHSIIYTSPAPRPLPEELPGRTARGDLENGMQPQSIRVESYDRGRALDPLSRLDYADRYEFEWGVPNITLFGRVHVDSHAALFVQYNSVWQSIRTAVQGHLGGASSTPTTTATTATGNTGRGSAAGGPSNTQGPSSTAATRGSSRADTAGSSTSTNAASNARALLRHFAQRGSGPCTDQQLAVIIWYLQEYARRQNHPRPGLTAQQMQDYARNADRRATWIQSLWAQWGATQESSSDEESDQDSDAS